VRDRAHLAAMQTVSAGHKRAECEGQTKMHTHETTTLPSLACKLLRGIDICKRVTSTGESDLKWQTGAKVPVNPGMGNQK